jgi:hypothetical protein
LRARGVRRMKQRGRVEVPMSASDGELDVGTAGETTRRGWHRALDWPLLLLLGWLVFELTADAAVGAVVACAKFGWNDLLTAHWLRRNDPRAARGRACFWFYLASGLWKVSVTAAICMFVALFVIMYEEAANPQRQNDPSAAVVAVFLQAAICFVLASGAATVGTACALRNRVKVWVDTAVHASRRLDRWPPSSGCAVNRARMVLTTSLITMVTLFFIGLFFVTSAIVGEPGRVNPGAAGWITGIMLAAMLLSAVFILGTREWLLRSIIATDPSQCWPWSEEPRPGDATRI